MSAFPYKQQRYRSASSSSRTVIIQNSNNDMQKQYNSYEEETSDESENEPFANAIYYKGYNKGRRQFKESPILEMSPLDYENNNKNDTKQYSSDDDNEQISQFKNKREVERNQPYRRYEPDFDDKPNRDYNVKRDSHKTANHQSQSYENKPKKGNKNKRDLPEVKKKQPSKLNKPTSLSKRSVSYNASSFDETPIRPLKNNPFMNRQNKKSSSMNSFDETPIKPLKHNPFMDDENTKSKYVPPKKSDNSRLNRQNYVRSERNVSYDVNFDEPDEPMKPIQNRFVKVRHDPPQNSVRNHLNTRPVVPAIEYKVPIEYKNDQLVLTRVKSPIIFRPESSKYFQPAPSVLRKKLVVATNDVEISSTRSLPFDESTTILIKTPRLQYIQQEHKNSLINIKHVIESNPTYPRVPPLLTLIEMTPEEVELEIRRRKSPVKTIVNHYFS